MSGVLMLTCLVLVCAPIGGSQPSDEARHYCGRFLTETLSEKCDKVYKRTMADPSAVLDYGDFARDGVVLDRGEAVSLISRNRGFRYKRGVASECCWKPCTLAELTSYCGP